VAALIEQMRHAGARTRVLKCWIVGGATVLNLAGAGNLPTIGQRNVEAVKAALELAGLPLLAEVTGGTEGRTVRFEVAAGCVLVRTILGSEEELWQHVR